MLYYISNPVMDVPNVLYVYWKHAVTFRGDSGEEVLSDDASSIKSMHEKFVPYEIERRVKLDFHTLQASQQVFSDEYERVKEMVNRAADLENLHRGTKDLEAEDLDLDFNTLGSRLVQSQKMPKLSLNIQNPK
jgi:hypothetical protein